MAEDQLEDDRSSFGNEIRSRMSDSSSESNSQTNSEEVYRFEDFEMQNPNFQATGSNFNVNSNLIPPRS